MSEYDALERLLESYLEGVASPEDVAELERLILASDAAADRASEWCLVHRQITELLTEQSLHEIMSQYAEGLQTLPRALLERRYETEEVNAPAEGAHIKAAHRGSRGLMGWLVAGTTAAAAVVFLALQIGSRPTPQAATDKASNSGPEVESAATVTRIADAVWAAGARPVRCGEQLHNGDRLALESGLIKVTFDCGAEVVLEGPCDFTIRDKMVGVLKRGKISANVPRRAFTFAILSPGVDFVDLGTAFGVSVDEHGESDLKVFEGEVLYSRNGGTDQQLGEAVHVEAKDSVAFNAVGEVAGDRAADAEFSPLLKLRRPAAVDGTPFPGDDLALWLKADAGVATDDEKNILSWQDTLYGGNRAGEDATQVDAEARPRFVADAVHGRPAVRFDGASDYMVTTPLETTDNQTVFLVCQFAEGAFDKSRRWGGQILNYDGPPGREASNMMAPGVLQIGEPLLESDFRPSAISSQVFAGFIGSAVIESGRTDAPPIGADRPVVIAYRYDFTHGKSQLAINGRVSGEGRAFAPQSLTSRKIIGRHAWKDLFFHGDLAELLIFNRALRDDDLAKVTSYLADKYAVDMDAAGGPTPVK